MTARAVPVFLAHMDRVRLQGRREALSHSADGDDRKPANEAADDREEIQGFVVPAREEQEHRRDDRTEYLRQLVGERDDAQIFASIRAAGKHLGHERNIDGDICALPDPRHRDSEDQAIRRAREHHDRDPHSGQQTSGPYDGLATSDPIAHPPASHCGDDAADQKVDHCLCLHGSCVMR